MNTSHSSDPHNLSNLHSKFDPARVVDHSQNRANPGSEAAANSIIEYDLHPHHVPTPEPPARYSSLDFRR